jgi:fluoride ion exporter CrcB/FEX
MLGDKKMMVIGAAIAALALLILVKKKGAAAAVGVELGTAAVNVVGGITAGAALTIGDAIGLPRTDQTECEKAIAEGRTWDASFACPASDWLSSLNPFK